MLCATIVKDVLNGFFILIENQYELGDVVSVAGVRGNVELMTLRRTVLRDVNDARLYLQSQDQRSGLDEASLRRLREKRYVRAER